MSGTFFFNLKQNLIEVLCFTVKMVTLHYEHVHFKPAQVIIEQINCCWNFTVIVDSYYLEPLVDHDIYIDIKK